LVRTAQLAADRVRSSERLGSIRGTLVDVTGLVIYFGVAALILRGTLL